MTPGFREKQYSEADFEEGEAPPLDPTPFAWVEPRTIPPRPWLYGHHLIRGQISVTVAMPATAKSSLVIAESLAMVSGRELLGDWVADKLRVWIFNLEDPGDELDRRIMAACLHHGLAAVDLGDRLFRDSGRVRGLCTAVQVRDGVMIQRPEMDALEAALARRRVDVLSVDPFVSSHQVSENDNVAIDLVAKEWARLAERCNCAIELVHHTRKLNGEEASSESGRGAIALLAAARSGRVLNRMSSADREQAGITDSDPGTYFSINRDKANLAPAGKRTWCRTVSVDLGQGDHVGVVEAWEWPDAFTGVTTRHLLQVQRAIRKQSDAGRPPRYSTQAQDWVGNIVAEVLDLDPKSDSKRISSLLAGWLKAGALKKCETLDAKRMPRPTVEVGEWVTE
jgi:AAA domain